MRKLSSKDLLPPKGTRDFPPEEQILRKNVFERIEKIFQRYGFEPIETPIVEKWETLAGKYGEEVESKLIWRFKLPYSEKEFGLRYDLTVPLARFVARFRPKLPFKRYQIGRIFRYDNPQKGRYREFWQCDADIVGSSSVLADVEILDLTSDVFEEFGFKNYTIRINDRRLLKGFFEKSLGIDDYNQVLQIYRIVDKLDKIGKNEVLKQLKEAGLSKDGIEKIEKLMDVSEKNEDVLEFFEHFEQKDIESATSSLRKILDYIKRPEKVKIDPSLVRGLDYYTGMIYEVVVTQPKIGSLAGGGRYDGLIGIFVGENIPAVGGSIGVERLIDAGLETGLLTKSVKTYTKVALIYTSDVDVKKVLEIAKKLRDDGINVFVPFESYKSIIDGIKDVSDRGIKFAVIFGKKEMEEGKLTLQNLETREKIKVDVEEIKEFVK